MNENLVMDKNLLHLFHGIVLENAEDDHAAFYVNQRDGVAFGGFRRSWGIGDLFARYRGNIGDFDWSTHPGVFNVRDNKFYSRTLLAGKMLPNGIREEVTEEMCNENFERALQNVYGQHSVVINPKQVLEWIRKRVMRTGGLDDKVINIMPFDVSNDRNEFAAQIEMYENEMVVLFRSPNGNIPLFIDKGSLLDTRFLSVGQWVVVKPIGIVEGKRIVKVLREHEPGVRMAIQGFKAGLLMPGDPRYSVHEQEDGNSITESDIKTFPFLPDQDLENIKSAPMFTIQLDTFERALKAMARYKRIELLYKNSHTPFVMCPFVREGESVVEVVGSSMSQYRSGKVVTK